MNSPQDITSKHCKQSNNAALPSDSALSTSDTLSVTDTSEDYNAQPLCLALDVDFTPPAIESKVISPVPINSTHKLQDCNDSALLLDEHTSSQLLNQAIVRITRLPLDCSGLLSRSSAPSFSTRSITTLRRSSRGSVTVPEAAEQQLGKESIECSRTRSLKSVKEKLKTNARYLESRTPTRASERTGCMKSIARTKSERKTRSSVEKTCAESRHSSEEGQIGNIRSPVADQSLREKSFPDEVKSDIEREAKSIADNSFVDLQGNCCIINCSAEVRTGNCVVDVETNEVVADASNDVIVDTINDNNSGGEVVTDHGAVNQRIDSSDKSVSVQENEDDGGSRAADQGYLTNDNMKSSDDDPDGGGKMNPGNAGAVGAISEQHSGDGENHGAKDRDTTPLHSRDRGDYRSDCVEDNGKVCNVPTESDINVTKTNCGGDDTSSCLRDITDCVETVISSKPALTNRLPNIETIIESCKKKAACKNFMNEITVSLPVEMCNKVSVGNKVSVEPYAGVVNNETHGKDVHIGGRNIAPGKERVEKVKRHKSKLSGKCRKKQRLDKDKNCTLYDLSVSRRDHTYPTNTKKDEFVTKRVVFEDLGKNPCVANQTGDFQGSKKEECVKNRRNVFEDMKRGQWDVNQREVFVEAQQDECVTNQRDVVTENQANDVAMVPVVTTHSVEVQCDDMSDLDELTLFKPLPKVAKPVRNNRADKEKKTRCKKAKKRRRSKDGSCDFLPSPPLPHSEIFYDTNDYRVLPSASGAPSDFDMRIETTPNVSPDSGINSLTASPVGNVSPGPPPLLHAESAFVCDNDMIGGADASDCDKQQVPVLDDHSESLRNRPVVSSDVQEVCIASRPVADRVAVKRTRGPGRPPKHSRKISTKPSSQESMEALNSPKSDHHSRGRPKGSKNKPKLFSYLHEPHINNLLFALQTTDDENKDALIASALCSSGEKRTVREHKAQAQLEIQRIKKKFAKHRGKIVVKRKPGRPRKEVVQYNDADFDTLIRSVRDSIDDQFTNDLSDFDNCCSDNSLDVIEPTLTPLSYQKVDKAKAKKSKVHVMMRQPKRRKSRLLKPRTPLTVQTQLQATESNIWHKNNTNAFSESDTTPSAWCGFNNRSSKEFINARYRLKTVSRLTGDHSNYKLDIFRHSKLSDGQRKHDKARPTSASTPDPAFNAVLDEIANAFKQFTVSGVRYVYTPISWDDIPMPDMFRLSHTMKKTENEEQRYLAERKEKMKIDSVVNRLIKHKASAKNLSSSPASNTPVVNNSMKASCLPPKKRHTLFAQSSLPSEAPSHPAADGQPEKRKVGRPRKHSLASSNRPSVNDKKATLLASKAAWRSSNDPHHSSVRGSLSTTKAISHKLNLFDKMQSDFVEKSPESFSKNHEADRVLSQPSGASASDKVSAIATNLESSLDDVKRLKRLLKHNAVASDKNKRQLQQTRPDNRKQSRPTSGENDDALRSRQSNNARLEETSRDGDVAAKESASCETRSQYTCTVRNSIDEAIDSVVRTWRKRKRSYPPKQPSNISKLKEKLATTTKTRAKLKARSKLRHKIVTSAKQKTLRSRKNRTALNVADSKVSILRQSRKRGPDGLPVRTFQSVGLFSNCYKSDAPSSDTRDEYVGSKRIMPSLAPFLSDTPIDYQLPYDVWWIHSPFTKEHQKDDHFQTTYKPLRQNVYVDIKPLCRYESHACMCMRPSDPGLRGCGEECLNRMIYTECSPATCPCGHQCSNMRIQKHESASDLDVYMTPDRGYGVRSPHFVPAGQFLVEYVGEVVSEAEFRRRMTDNYSQDRHHYCLSLDRGAVIDGYRMGSVARFINHSCQPNCEMQKWNVNGVYRMAVFALQDIAAGEEFCYDYNFHAFNLETQQTCKCGSENCRGTIGGKNQKSQQKGVATKEVKDITRKVRSTVNKPRDKPSKADDSGTPPNKTTQHQHSSAKPLSTRERVFARKHAIFLCRNVRAVLESRVQYIQNRSHQSGCELSLLPAMLPDRSIRTRCLSLAEESNEVSRAVRLSQSLKQIFATLICYKDEDGNVLASTVMSLPSRRRHPEYYEIIQRPIDLTIIQKNLYSGVYKTHEEFDSDILLLFSNVEKYCGKKSAMGKLIAQLRRVYTNATNDVIPQDNTSDVYTPDGPDQGLPPFKEAVVDKDEEVIRCICGILRDEGVMIQCEQCDIWQHMDCVGAIGERDHYKCERCQPRRVPKEILYVPQPDDSVPGLTYYMTVMKGTTQLRVGDCVYIIRDETITRNPDGHSKSPTSGCQPSGYDRKDIFRIEQLWRNKAGERFAYGHHYYRPLETFHEPTRKFFHNEVFRIPLYDVLPMEAIVGRCLVMDLATYCKGRPKVVNESDVYVCEYRLDKTAHMFYKISKPRWPINTKTFCFNKFVTKLNPKRTYSPHEVPEAYKRRGTVGTSSDDRPSQADAHSTSSHPRSESNHDGDTTSEAGSDDVPLAVVKKQKIKEKKKNLETILKGLLSRIPGKHRVDVTHLLEGGCGGKRAHKKPGRSMKNT